eukprot:6015014-Pyramimonas_sp.AAC.1
MTGKGGGGRLTKDPYASRCSSGSLPDKPRHWPPTQRGAAPVCMLSPWRGTCRGPRGELVGDYIIPRGGLFGILFGPS